MKFNWDKKYLYWGVTAFLVIVASISFFILLYNIDGIASGIGSILNIFTPVLFGFIIAYLLAPVASFFEIKCFRVLLTKIDDRKQKKREEHYSAYKRPDNGVAIRKMSRVLSVLVALLIALLIVVGLISAVLPQLLDTIQSLANNIPTYLKDGTKWATELLSGYPDIQQTVTDFLANSTTMLNDFLTKSILPQMTDIMGTLSSSLGNVLGTFLNIILGFIISIYFLYNKELFSAQCKKALYSILNPRHANKVLRYTRDIHKTFGGFITGKLIDSMIIGLLFFILLTIFNIPYALLVSVMMGVTNIIPYFGPFIGAIPAALLILMENPLSCLYFIIMVVVIQQFDGNVLSPKILGESTGLSSFWVIFAILLGQGLFGFVGLIIGIPLFAVVYEVIKNKVAKRLRARELTTSSNDFRNIAFIDPETNEPYPLDRFRAEQEAKEKAEHEQKELEKNKLKREHKAQKDAFRAAKRENIANKATAANKANTASKANIASKANTANKAKATNKTNKSNKAKRS